MTTPNNIPPSQNPSPNASTSKQDRFSEPARFEERSLWDVLGDMLKTPDKTLIRFFRTIALKDESAPDDPKSHTPRDNNEPEATPAKKIAQTETEGEAHIPPTADTLPEALPVKSASKATIPPAAMLGGILAAIFFASIGGIVLWNAALDNTGQPAGFMNGAPIFFCISGFIYIAVSILASAAWWQKRLNRSSQPVSNTASDTSDSINAEASSDDDSSLETTIDQIDKQDNEDSLENGSRPFNQIAFDWVIDNALALLLLPVGLMLARLAYTQNVIYDSTGTQVRDVVFTTTGTWMWILAILVWILILTVNASVFYRRFFDKKTSSTPSTQPTIIQKIGRWRPRVGWQHIALLFIMLLAAYFRLHDLEGVPPEMTSDHIEKLLDAVRVHEGYNGIFFRNNGGREGFQMHYIAFLVEVTGMDFSFNALKLATASEGLLNVLIGYWLGVVMLERNRRMGIWLGLCFAALLAISSWHVMLSRLGLRIVLTPLSTTLLMIFFVKAMRYNRRRDFVITGIILGAGMYFYQANRMLPLVVVIGTVMAAGINAKDWRDGMKYAFNLAAAGIIALVIFIPMYRFQQQFPDDFWNRTRGRIFGEEAFIRTDPNTGLAERYEPSTSEQLDRFFDDFDKFEENYKDALRMWSWKGDGAWINNGESRPALDPFTDGLLILGALAWLILIFRSWDVGHIVVPVGILVMLLPTAMTLAYQIENPSFTRASGTVPFIFLIAAYPLAQIGYYTQEALAKNKTAAVLLGSTLISGVVLLAAPINYESFYEVYRDSYARSWKPYEAYAAPMKTFAQSEGSYGNAFMIAYPHWLDHRILGTVAGDIKWNNGLVNRTDVFAFIGINEGTPYTYNPAKPLYFMFNQADTDTSQWLKAVFPDGEERLVVIEDRPELNFYTYTVPPNIDWSAALARSDAWNETANEVETDENGDDG